MEEVSKEVLTSIFNKVNSEDLSLDNFNGKSI